LLAAVVPDDADEKMTLGIIRRVRLAHVVVVASLVDAAVEIDEIVIRHVPPVSIASAPRLQAAQLFARVVLGLERLRTSRVMQRHVRDAMWNAESQIGATGYCRRRD